MKRIIIISLVVGLLVVVGLNLFTTEVYERTPQEEVTATSTSTSIKVDTEEIMSSVDFQKYMRTVAEVKGLLALKEEVTIEYEKEISDIEQRLSELRSLEMELITSYDIPSLQ